MRKKKGKYASLPNAPEACREDDIDNLVLQFGRENGRSHKIDLRFLINGKHPRAQLARSCAKIFVRYTQDFAAASRSSLLHSLRRFNEFLEWREEGSEFQPVVSTVELSAPLLLEYQAYLGTVSNITETTAHGYYSEVARFLNLIVLHNPEWLPCDFKIPPCPFKHKPYSSKSTPSKIIGLSDLALIAKAALKEVEEIRNNHQRAIGLLNTPATLKYTNQGRPKSLASLSNVMHHVVNSGRVTSYLGNMSSSLRRNGHPSLEKILSWYIPTATRHLVPFLVLLHIRTALNPTTLCRLKRNCLVEHPLPVGLTILRFSKARAGHRANQEMCYPSNQPGGVVDLVNLLLEYTRPLTKMARSEEKNRLFLYRDGRQGVRSAEPDWSFAHRALRQFVARNNLPRFTFNQLRPSVATSLYLQTKDIFRIQRLLGHASVRTTVRYVKGIIVQEQHKKEMNEGIRRMTEAVLGTSSRQADYQVFSGPVDEVVTEKIKNHELSEESGAKIISGGFRTFMGRCKDPCNSPQPGEVPGRVCRSLHACIFCPNCWIFAEDLPNVISYRESLYAERAGMTDAEWDMFYGEVVREINESILAAFPEESVRQAEEVARSQGTQSIVTWKVGG